MPSDGISTDALHYDLREAATWLKRVYSESPPGWGWVQHIPPNAQNTAEVLLALLSLPERDPSPEFPDVVRSCVEHNLVNCNRSATRNLAWATRALIEVRRQNAYEAADTLDGSIGSGLDALRQLQNPDGGWPEVADEPSQVTWTALTLMLLGGELPEDSVAAATDYLEGAQRSDGGWPLWTMSPDEVEARFKDHPRMIASASSQVNSNAACTAYAVLALGRRSRNYRAQKRGVAWLIAHIDEHGRLPLFQQVSVIESEVSTFRHFSTCWALQAILAVDPQFVFNDRVASLVMYLLGLRDQATGGWRASEDSDPYTWATCNAIYAMRSVLQALQRVNPDMFLVLAQWHRFRELAASSWFEVRGHRLSVNASAALAIAVLTTVICALATALLFGHAFPIEFVGIPIFVVMAALPWLVYLRVGHGLSWGSGVGWVAAVGSVAIGLLYALVEYVK